MGLFGLGGKAPKYPTITAPTVKSGADYYSGAMDFGNQNFGNAMGARESALGDLSSGQDYYAGFQPTSFENALSNQYFNNVWPDQQAFMQNQLSKSGMAYSPVAAATLGKAYGNTAFNIGQYLSDQGNQRAQYSLQSRLSIDPMSQILSPYANFGADQGNLQDQYNFNVQKQNADAQYANAMQKYMQDQQMMAMVGQIGGAVAGGMVGGPQGAMMGAGAGGSLMGGGQNMGTYLQAAQGMGGQGGGGAMPVYSGGWGSGNQPGTGIFGSRFGGKTQSELLGFPTQQYR